MNDHESCLILIVDDDPKSLQLLGNLLREHGYKPTITRNGQEALKFVQKRQPTCILLDIMMPEIDGIETCRRLKALEQSKDIPVIFLTGVTDTWNKVRAFEAGGVDYITKPFEAEEVLVRVATHSRMRLMQLQLQAQNTQLQQEIRERRRTEIALRRLEEAINTTQVGVTIADTEGAIIYTNPADAALHGYTVQELLGKSSSIFAPPETWNKTARQHLDREHFHNWERESVNVRRDASTFPVKLVSNTIYDSAGTVIGTVTICEDITQRKKNEEELQEAKRLADAANQAKSMFLASMSHELRTPLNGILGYAQIMQHSRHLSEGDRKDLQVIEESGNHLLTLINDVLDLSKIEAGKVELNPEPCSLPALLLTVTTMIQMKAARKGIEFREECDPDLPVTVIADETRLRQVLLNLLGNAVKFTEQGSVILSVKKMYTDHDPQSSIASLQFSISDTGIGIPRKKTSELFKPFQQVHDRRLKVEGTGLGLSISAKIVTLMGGLIAVESDLGQGSRFWFEVDLPVIPSSPAEPESQPRQIIGLVGPSPKILVVDDRPDNSRVVHAMLAPLGFTMAEAEDGEDALQQIGIFQPDLILLDLRMPGMDGFELARTIRDIAPGPSNPVLNEVKIIAVSASVFGDTRQRSLDDGCHDFLPKPVREPELLDMLARHLPIQWRYEEDAAPDTDNAAERMALPPINILAELREAASIGDIHYLSEQFKQFTAHDNALQPFVEAMQPLLKTFQIERLHQELEQLLEHAESGTL